VIRDNSDVSWEKWGKKNPYYAVLTDDRFRNENLTNELKAEFFASGPVHMERILATAVGHFGEMAFRKSALDFGCGVGRLAIPLARTFDHVTGVDISPAMIGIAQQRCLECGIENVDFVLSDDELTRVKGKFDFIHSFIVLQHIPTRRGEQIIEQLLKRLSTEGILAIHFPLMRKASIVRKSINSLRRNFAPLSILVNIVQRRPWNEPFMQTNNYDVNHILILLSEHGIKNVFLDVIDAGGFLSVYALAKKP
jgi:SAM-dependent methyltransferase